MRTVNDRALATLAGLDDKKFLRMQMTAMVMSHPRAHTPANDLEQQVRNALEIADEIISVIEAEP